MTVVVSAKERDAIYSLIALTFGAECEELDRAMRDGDWEACYRLGRRVSDALRLIQDGGLGWGDIAAEGDIELHLPDEELPRILLSLRRDAVNYRESYRPEQEEMRAEWEEVELKVAACTGAIDQLRGSGA